MNKILQDFFDKQKEKQNEQKENHLRQLGLTNPTEEQKQTLLPLELKYSKKVPVVEVSDEEYKEILKLCPIEKQESEPSGIEKFFKIFAVITFIVTGIFLIAFFVSMASTPTRSTYDIIHDISPKPIINWTYLYLSVIELFSGFIYLAINKSLYYLRKISEK